MQHNSPKVYKFYFTLTAYLPGAVIPASLAISEFSLKTTKTPFQLVVTLLLLQIGHKFPFTKRLQVLQAFSVI